MRKIWKDTEQIPVTNQEKLIFLTIRCSKENTIQFTSKHSRGYGKDEDDTQNNISGNNTCTFQIKTGWSCTWNCFPYPTVKMLTSNIFSSNPISGKLWLKLYMTLFSIILSKCSLVIYSQVTHSSKILRLYLVWKMKRRDKKRCTTCGHHLWEIPVTHTLMSN